MPTLKGQGIGVAVVDSGITPHSALQVTSGGASRVITATNTTTSTDALDAFGHGTHVAGIIGGNGAWLGRRAHRRGPRGQPDQRQGQQ